MTIWLLAVVLLASLTALGYRQGAIRVAFSCVGIIAGAVLAPWLGKLLKPLFLTAGLKNPLLVWLLGPLLVFVLISVLFKLVALQVHHKVDVHYKYHAGDLRLVLWERLNRRLGLALGLLNGTLYLVLISWIIYCLGYWTFQTATSETDPKTIKVLNRLAEDLQATGFNKVARAIDRLPAAYYDTADLAGIVYHNSLLQARLARYPGFLALAERPEFQDLAKDKDFIEMWQRGDPIMNVVDHPKVQAVVNDPELMRSIWETLMPDLGDLRTFLEKGHSPKYGAEKILGRWKFDLNAAFAALRRAKPNLPSSEMQKLRKWMEPQFVGTSFVATPQHQAIFKNLPQISPGGSILAGSAQTVQGQWSNIDGKYQLTLPGEQLLASVEGDRLAFKKEGMDLVFDRED